MTDRALPGRGVLRVEIGADSKLELQRFTGEERFSAPFLFTLHIHSDHPLDPAQVIAAPVKFRAEFEDGSVRHFHGHVASIGRDQVSETTDLFAYVVEVRPWFWFLGFRTNVRIFERQEVRDIFEAIAAEYPDAKFVAQLNRQHPVREYSVQYRESDLDFLSRLLEEAGISYWFRHEADKHTMVLSDSNAAFAACEEGIVSFAARGKSFGAIHRWSRSNAYVSGSMAVRDYNYRSPSGPVEGESKGKLKLRYTGSAERYDFAGRFTTPAEGEQVARLRIEAEEATHAQIAAEGTCRTLGVGGKFSIDDTFEGVADLGAGRDFLVTAVNHVGIAKPTERDTLYRCHEISCIPADVEYRPPRRTPRAVVFGPHTAVVVDSQGEVSPASEEIHTDPQGRIRVRFHWSRIDGVGKQVSCWLRVAQASAGKGFGAWFLPRVGHEVVVEFLEGDPDRPLVTGSVYHPSHPQSLASAPSDGEATSGGLKEIQTQSWIRSRSTPGGSEANFNEVRFEDSKGSEVFFVQAEKDKQVLVKNDRSENVGHDETITIGHDRTETVKNDEKITVHHNRTERVDVDESISVGANRKRDVGGNESVDVSGNQSISIGKNQTETVAMAKAETIGLAKALTIGAAYQVSVGGVMNTTVGAASAEQVGLSKSVIVGDKIEITCGKSKLTMDKGGKITIEGSLIEMKATGNVVVKGSKIELN